MNRLGESHPHVLNLEAQAPGLKQQASMEPGSALFTLTLFTFVFVIVLLPPSPYYYRPRYEYYSYECRPRRAYPAY